MPSWLLLVALFVVWLLWALAASAGRAVEQARRGVPEGRRGGVSIAPVIPFFPLAFWGVAWLVDRVAGPWGTVVIGGAHATLGMIFVASIVRDLWRLRSLGRRS